jgi:hypothetical protein
MQGLAPLQVRLDQEEDAAMCLKIAGCPKFMVGFGVARSGRHTWRPSVMNSRLKARHSHGNSPNAKPGATRPNRCLEFGGAYCRVATASYAGSSCVGLDVGRCAHSRQGLFCVSTPTTLLPSHIHIHSRIPNKPTTLRAHHVGHCARWLGPYKSLMQPVCWVGHYYIPFPQVLSGYPTKQTIFHTILTRVDR